MLKTNDRDSVSMLKEGINADETMWFITAKVINNDEELESTLKDLQSKKYVKYSTRTLHLLDAELFLNAVFPGLPDGLLEGKRVLVLDPDEWQDIDVYTFEGFAKLTEEEKKDLGVTDKIASGDCMDFDNLYGQIAEKVQEIGFEIVMDGYFYNKYLK